MLKIGDKVKVKSKYIEILDYGMIDNVIGTIIATDNESSCLVKFPFVDDWFHDGNTFHHRVVAQGSHSDKNDSLWFHEVTLEKVV